MREFFLLTFFETRREITVKILELMCSLENDEEKKN